MRDTAPAGDPATADLAGLYRETRQRLAGLIAALDGAALATPVPACPGWAVRDVLAHLAATAQDAISGRLAGIPTEEHTAEQVRRFADVPVPELLAGWAAASAQFEQLVAAFQVWPAVIDVASHEQDIRGALGRPGARDTEAIRLGTASVLSRLQVPVPLRVVTEDGELVASPAGPGSSRRDGASRDGAGREGPGREGPGREGPGREGTNPAEVAELTLRTSRFEAFRWRLGRRSRAQLAAMDWSGDPAAVLGHLAIFGPSASDIIE